jgi:hypothetical protein
MRHLAALATLLVVGCGGGVPVGGDGGGGGGGGDVDMSIPTGQPLACGRTSPNPKPGDTFATGQWALVATWNGAATLPGGWLGPSPYQVEISFRADGTYTAQTTDGSNVLPFYYDKNPEQGRYELVDLHANGDVSGNIYLDWSSSPDQLNAIRFNATQTHVHFEYFHGGYGPVVYELDCAAQVDPTIWDMTAVPMDPADLAF